MIKSQQSLVKKQEEQLKIVKISKMTFVEFMAQQHQQINELMDSQEQSEDDIQETEVEKEEQKDEVNDTNSSWLKHVHILKDHIKLHDSFFENMDKHKKLVTCISPLFKTYPEYTFFFSTRVQKNPQLLNLETLDRYNFLIQNSSYKSALIFKCNNYDTFCTAQIKIDLTENPIKLQLQPYHNKACIQTENINYDLKSQLQSADKLMKKRENQAIAEKIDFSSRIWYTEEDYENYILVQQNKAFNQNLKSLAQMMKLNPQFIIIISKIPQLVNLKTNEKWNIDRVSKKGFMCQKYLKCNNSLVLSGEEYQYTESQHLCKQKFVPHELLFSQSDISMAQYIEMHKIEIYVQEVQKLDKKELKLLQHKVQIGLKKVDSDNQLIDIPIDIYQSIYTVNKITQCTEQQLDLIHKLLPIIKLQAERWIILLYLHNISLINAKSQEQFRLINVSEEQITFRNEVWFHLSPNILLINLKDQTISFTKISQEQELIYGESNTPVAIYKSLYNVRNLFGQLILGYNPVKVKPTTKEHIKVTSFELE